MRASPPAEYAPVYAAMRRDYGPPPAAVAAAPVGVRIYPEPPAGCYWSSGTLWWTVQPGDVLFFVHHLVRAHNGHREVTAAVVDLHRTGQDLKRVAVPSPSLSRDLAVWQGRWAAVRILRDGRRRPWRAVALDSGRWADHASDLNASG